MILVKSDCWLRRTGGQPAWLLATWVCPACGLSCGLSGETHQVETNGTVTPNVDCPHSVGKEKCKFRNQSLKLEGWLPLWAIAFERFMGRDGHKPIWKPETHYCHAVDYEAAKAEFHNSENGTRSLTKVVAIGPVIGYHVKDQDGKILSV